jgi:hypothetical protein
MRRLSFRSGCRIAGWIAGMLFSVVGAWLLLPSRNVRGNTLFENKVNSCTLHPSGISVSLFLGDGGAMTSFWFRLPNAHRGRRSGTRSSTPMARRSSRMFAAGRGHTRSCWSHVDAFAGSRASGRNIARQSAALRPGFGRASSATAPQERHAVVGLVGDRPTCYRVYWPRADEHPPILASTDGIPWQLCGPPAGCPRWSPGQVSQRITEMALALRESTRAK